MGQILNHLHWEAHCGPAQLDGPRQAQPCHGISEERWTYDKALQGNNSSKENQHLLGSSLAIKSIYQRKFRKVRRGSRC